VDEEGFLYVFGYCKDKCEKVISSCEMIGAIKEIRMTPLADAEENRERIM
jgi:hypothetical protein